MREATRWRLALARRIAASYARNPNARAVMIAGSVGRGTADRYSDIEIDVYYAEPPGTAQRIAAVEGCGGTVELLDEDADEWEEQLLIGGFHAASSTFLIATLERYLHEVVDHGLIAPLAQVRLYSLLHAIPIKGRPLIEQWQARARAYPDALVHAMLHEHLPFHGFWYAEDMLAARDDALLLHEIFVQIGRQLLGALLGLNRVYLSTPGGLKWMDETIAALPIKPDELGARIRHALTTDLASGVHVFKRLIVETLDLVDQHAPGFDTAPYRANFERRRPVWDAPPPALAALLAAEPK